MRQASLAQLLDVVEACYRVDASEQEWLAGIVRSATPLLDGGLGVTAYTYDARNASRFELVDACLPAGVDPEALRAYLRSVPAEFVERTWLAEPCGLASRTEGFAELAPALAAFGGARDVIALNGRDPTAMGVWLGALLPRRGRESPAANARFTKVAAHLATAYRLRRALGSNATGTDGADAILRPDGHVEHAEREARGAEARDALRKATLRFDRAKTAAGRKNVELSLSGWKGMVEARWTLLDHFDHDGRRYVVARRNDAGLDALTTLTARERQVVAYAALGHDNKVIAYELGLAAATVRVLLHRAAQKLGTTRRAELVARYREAAALERR